MTRTPLVKEGNNWLRIVQIYYRSNFVVLDILITLYFQLGHTDQSPPATLRRDTEKKSETVKGEQGIYYYW